MFVEWRVFERGDRVEVQEGGECPHQTYCGGWHGARGTVVDAVDPPIANDGHRFAVHLILDSGTEALTWFCAAELRLVPVP